MLNAKNGDLSGIANLFDRFHLRLFNFFYQRNRNKALSEDLTQAVFEKVIKNRNNYNNSNSFVSWIFTIARNINIDHFRKKKLILPGDEGLSTLIEPDVENLEENENIIKVRKAIKLLSMEDQEILQLTKFQKMRYKEVAELLDISESAVKVKVHRSLKKLKDAFYNIA